MTEIANATFNYSSLNEIMPMIYKRFTEKAAEEWRQIYKALQLLEFLIKNGSERVIDDARSHLSLLKMLRQFHYIDQNGKDQGINVRNRAKELAEMLSDVDRIRGERKKARQTRGKYGGVEGGAGLGGSSSSSRYGGFGSETGPSFGGFSGGVYGDGGGFGGSTSEYDESQGTQPRRERFEEYDEYDEGTSSAPSRRRAEPSKPPKAEPPKAKAPEVDLFDFSADDDPAPIAPASNGRTATQTSALDDFGGFASATGGDDDFDDFQSAAQTTSTSAIQPPASTSTITSSTQYAAPTPVGGQSQFNNIFNSTISPPPSSTGTPAAANYSAFKSPPISAPQQPVQATPSYQQPKPMPTSYQAAQPNYFGSIPVSAATSTGSPAGGLTSPGVAKSGTASKAGSSADPFASLNIGGSKKATTGPAKQSMADMAKQKTSAGIWEAPAQSTQQKPPQGYSGNSGGDLLGL